MRRFGNVSLVYFVTCAFIFSSMQAMGQDACRVSRSKIVGGSAARIADWPGQAALRLHSEAGHVSFYFCGGSAIAGRWILTAAHCLPEYLTKLTGTVYDSHLHAFDGQLEVVIGAEDLRSIASEQVYRVDRIVMHEKFRTEVQNALKLDNEIDREKAIEAVPEKIGNDIALIHLARPWQGAAAALSLGSATRQTIPPHTQVRIAGYGKTEKNKSQSDLKALKSRDGSEEIFSGAPSLLEAAVETISTGACKSVYAGARIGDGQICAGLEEGGRDSCQGDSGGPLAIMGENGCPSQIGIVSWGAGCAEANAYGIYTRISAYADWIQNITGPLSGSTSIQAALPEGPRLTAVQLDEALSQLQSVLGAPNVLVKAQIQGGNRVKLGDHIVIEASSEISGRIVILDINANRDVTLLYPNKYVPAAAAGRIAAGAKVAIPGDGYPGFTAFKAVEPVGKGRLLAIVLPNDFDLERFAAGPDLVSKGFAPVDEAPSYLIRLIRQIEKRRSSSGRPDIALDATGSGWGFGMTEYEIAR